MIETRQIDLTPEEYHVPELRRRALMRKLGLGEAEVDHARIVRRTLDCRRRNVVYHCNVELGVGSEELGVDSAQTHHSSLITPHSPRVVVVGAGPAGLFAALRALELGLRPVIVERGKPVEQRKYDIAALTREKRVNPDSNWCFGEGGAGTYSDGKLYTRSTKRGNVDDVLRRFVAHGADPDIMLDAHAHIGTDRLSGIIANMRHTIEQGGGEYHFNTRVEDFIVTDGRVRGVVVRPLSTHHSSLITEHSSLITEHSSLITEHSSLNTQHSSLITHHSSLNTHHSSLITITADAVILATGHSARDIYRLFYDRGWALEAKPFALGVRVEHPQQLINEIQYHGPGYSRYLPPAAYSLTAQAGNHGVFSFCMCPGGVIVPAATADGQQVVNGMSNSRRNSPYANSGIAVTVGLEDVPSSTAHPSPFALLDFQMAVERRIFEAAGGTIDAPAQRLTDFLRRRPSQQLPKSGYMGQTVNAPLHELLPPFVVEALAQGFRDFDRKMHGFVTDEALLLAVESRTSSPVRIPRDPLTLQHTQLAGLYPCGEGAGYAGGIVSSALDGIRCIEAVKKSMDAQ